MKFKCVIIILLSVVICSTSYAADTGLKVDENGNVRIGIAEPQTPLHVNGSLTVGNENGATTYNVARFFTNQRTTNYVHIKLPFSPDISSNMFHIKVRGYAYSGPSKIVDLTYVGYAYHHNNSITHTSVLDPTGQLNPVIYKGSDGYVYLRFSPGNTYYLTFAVDSMRVGNGRIIKPGEISILISAAETL